MMEQTQRIDVDFCIVITGTITLDAGPGPVDHDELFQTYRDGFWSYSRFIEGLTLDARDLTMTVRGYDPNARTMPTDEDRAAYDRMIERQDRDRADMDRDIAQAEVDMLEQWRDHGMGKE